jgi:hypothetical protein
VSIDLDNTAQGETSCASVEFANAVTSDTVLAKPQTMPTGFAEVSARVIAPGFIQFCAIKVNAGSVDPAAFPVFVAVYIPFVVGDLFAIPTRA